MVPKILGTRPVSCDTVNVYNKVVYACIIGSILRVTLTWIHNKSNNIASLVSMDLENHTSQSPSSWG